MEGPSLYLAQEQLRPFKKRAVRSATGNTKMDKERLIGKEVRDIFAWGKHLVFQFDTFALRFHFLLFGTFEAEVEGTWITGDYRRARTPRLSLTFDNGQIHTYNCSVKFIETAQAKRMYDFTIDIMSPRWDATVVRTLLRSHSEEEIGDVLLDQEIFAGVGNIIKNEVLSLEKIAPQRIVRTLSSQARTKLIARTRVFSKQFLRWRRKFVLRKNLRVHRRRTCPYCGGKLLRAKMGTRNRWSYWCPIDQT